LLFDNLYFLIAIAYGVIKMQCKINKNVSFFQLFAML